MPQNGGSGGHCHGDKADHPQDRAKLRARETMACEPANKPHDAVATNGSHSEEDAGD